jgi:hypothetical protein
MGVRCTCIWRLLKKSINLEQKVLVLSIIFDQFFPDKRLIICDNIIHLKENQVKQSYIVSIQIMSDAWVAIKELLEIVLMLTNWFSSCKQT